MGAQQVSTVVFTVTATGAIAQRRAVSRTAAQAGAGAGNIGVPILGFADFTCVLGEALKVNVGPTALAEAGAAIDGSVATLKTDANGRLIPTSGGSDVVAAILKPGQTATASGDPIEVVPTVN